MSTNTYHPPRTTYKVHDDELVKAGLPDPDNGIYATTIMPKKVQEQFVTATRDTLADTRMAVTMDWSDPWKYTADPIGQRISAAAATPAQPIKDTGVWKVGHNPYNRYQNVFFGSSEADQINMNDMTFSNVETREVHLEEPVVHQVSTGHGQHLDEEEHEEKKKKDANELANLYYEVKNRQFLQDGLIHPFMSPLDRPFGNGAHPGHSFVHHHDPNYRRKEQRIADALGAELNRGASLYNLAQQALMGGSTPMASPRTVGGTPRTTASRAGPPASVATGVTQETLDTVPTARRPTPGGLRGSGPPPPTAPPGEM